MLSGLLASNLYIHFTGHLPAKAPFSLISQIYGFCNAKPVVHISLLIYRNILGNSLSFADASLRSLGLPCAYHMHPTLILPFAQHSPVTEHLQFNCAMALYAATSSKPSTLQQQSPPPANNWLRCDSHDDIHINRTYGSCSISSPWYWTQLIKTSSIKSQENSGMWCKFDSMPSVRQLNSVGGGRVKVFN